MGGNKEQGGGNREHGTRNKEEGTRKGKREGGRGSREQRRGKGEEGRGKRRSLVDFCGLIAFDRISRHGNDFVGEGLQTLAESPSGSDGH
ncbi:MAG: hypothetical protein Q8P22_06920 [Chloroflexota bacterium]|nr:hypothetical protein [Chloroflexota bacterium]